MGESQHRAQSRPLPVVVSPLEPDEIIRRLDARARRGKLAGFEKGGGGELFRVSAHGTPFDRLLVSKGDSGPEGSRLEFGFRWVRTMPAVFLVSLIVSVWPGLPLTDTMLAMWFGWYERLVSPDGWFRTWMWYLPLTVPFLPLVWRSAMGKSRASSTEHALETIEQIAGTIDGRVEPAETEIRSTRTGL